MNKHEHARQPAPSGHSQFKEWNRHNAHVEKNTQKIIAKEGREHHKEVTRIEKGKEPCKERRGSECIVS